PAGDNPGAVRRRLQEDAPGAEDPGHLVGNRPIDHRHRDQATLGSVDSFADRLRHLVRLAHTETDVAVTVADHDERAEAEAASALDHLGHAVDGDDLFLELETLRIDPFDGCHGHE